MQELQTLNREPSGTASNAQIMFVVMNTAGLTFDPDLGHRHTPERGAEAGLGAGFNAADIFRPRCWSPLPRCWPACWPWPWPSACRCGAHACGCRCWPSAACWRRPWLAARLPAERAAQVAGTTGAAVILGVVLLFLLAGTWRRVNMYDAFIDGARKAFGVAGRSFPI